MLYILFIIFFWSFVYNLIMGFLGKVPVDSYERRAVIDILFCCALLDIIRERWIRRYDNHN